MESNKYFRELSQKRQTLQKYRSLNNPQQDKAGPAIWAMLQKLKNDDGAEVVSHFFIKLHGLGKSKVLSSRYCFQRLLSKIAASGLRVLMLLQRWVLEPSLPI